MVIGNARKVLFASIETQIISTVMNGCMYFMVLDPYFKIMEHVKKKLAFLAEKSAKA